MTQTHEDNSTQAFWGERGCPALFFGFELPRFISWVAPFGRGALDRARNLGGNAVVWLLGRTPRNRAEQEEEEEDCSAKGNGDRNERWTDGEISSTKKTS